MSTATLTPETRRNVALFAAGDLTTQAPNYRYEERDDNRILVIEGLPVFRSGTFRDSMGFQHSWESIHMDQMVSHFDLLRGRSIFSDVPVRSGHPGWLTSGQEGNGKVVGYHTRLYVETRISKTDAKEYSYLLSDVEILDDEAIKAIEKGLWRNRSAEVGSYVTNDEAEFWPVYMGVAYIDIPAVEGLNSFSKQSNFSLMMETESTVSDSKTKAQAPPEELKSPQPPAPPTQNADEHGRAGGGVTAAPTPPVPTHVFSVGGQEVSDFAAVQAHIDSLEAFQSEAITARRTEFVKGLVTAGKVLAPQEEATQAFASSLDSKQFESWKATWADVPANTLLGNYGQSSQQGGVPDESAATAQEKGLETARAIIEMHQRGGVSADEIKRTASYKALIAADSTFTL